MVRSTTAAALTTLLLASGIHAQYAINPNSVPLSSRTFWCQQQQAQCPLICLQYVSNNDASTRVNQCDPSQLTYGCVCSDGTSPNISEYSQTLPFYICQEWGNQCVSNCGNGNTVCQSDCRDNHPCGAQNPVLKNQTNSSSTTTSALSSSTSSMGGGQTTVVGSSTVVVYNSVLGGGSSSSKGSSGSQTGAATRFRGWALGAGQTFGGLALAGAFFGGFAVLL